MPSLSCYIPQSCRYKGTNTRAISPRPHGYHSDGASYYSEYMPYERTDEDVALMKKAGISVVRIGEFAWGLWEPEDGRFEFAWMDRVVDKLHAAGIRIILGTPTASIPAWMYEEHPEIVRLALAMLAIRQMGCCGVRQQRWFFIVPFPLRA